MKQHLKSILALVSIVGVMGLLLAVTNSITAPIIEKNQAAAASGALLEVFPEGTGFEAVDMSGATLPATVVEAHKETTGKGYVFKLVTTGYGNGLTLMCGVTTEGIITGATCIASNETNSAEKTYGASFIGKDLAGTEAVDTIAGSTITSNAYKGALIDAINAATILGGGSVDLRTPEQILQDNLKAALPEGDTFTKVFLTESVEGVDAIYAADNGAGYVGVIGEEFIAAGGDNAVVNTAVDAIKNSTLTEVDLTKHEGVHQNINWVKKTASGNYVLEVKGAGYGIVGGDDYHPASGEYIIIQIAISKDGKILDCFTVSQKETENIGDVCAKESFYGQFDGKTAETYTEVEAIAGATMTTNGYMKAIERCFEAVAILEGGAQ